MGSWVYQLQMRDLPEGSNTNTLMQQELEKLGNEKCRENEIKKDNFFLWYCKSWSKIDIPWRKETRSKDR